MVKRGKQNRKQRRRRLRGREVIANQGETTKPPAAPSERPLSRTDWAGPDGSIGVYIREEREKSLEAYRNQPNLVAEHANLEEDTSRGGYANRQLFELVQNGADALAGSKGGRIWIRLTPTHLYCADEGQPVDSDGVTALMFARLSSKRGTAEIGRFGLGFKSVLAVSDTPEFFSRSGSFQFDRTKSAKLIRSIAPNAERYPVLRLPEPIDPWPEMESDPILRQLMKGWAINIIRLPLKPGAYDGLSEQIKDFPPEFLLFVDHVSQLELEVNGQNGVRIISLRSEDGYRLLDDGGDSTQWMLTRVNHKLSSDAKSDSRALDNANEVQISWAAPIDRLNEPGKFWAYFPTMTTSLLAGILNAPWKTNEDRQNLLPGIYNEELIDAAAEMVAGTLTRLSKVDDPAKHLDALPRRRETGDSEHSNRLRDRLHSHLQDLDIVPDQDCNLRNIHEVLYPPSKLTPDREEIARNALERWASFDGRPSNWLHHSALNRTRLSALDRLYDAHLSLPRASISEWLEALIENAKSQQAIAATSELKADCEQLVFHASMAAIKTASLIPKPAGWRHDYGDIVLTAGGKWVKPDPDTVRLGESDVHNPSTLVHPQLQEDGETLRALKELGIRPASSETEFRDFASKIFSNIKTLHEFMYESLADPDADWTRARQDIQLINVDGSAGRQGFWTRVRAYEAARKVISEMAQSYNDWREFWILAREAGHLTAARVIQSYDDWREILRVRTLSGEWRTLFYALLPGSIVPADGSRDRNVTIDIQFHAADLPLLEQLGAVEAPRARHQLSPWRSEYFISRSKDEFREDARSKVGRTPQEKRLKFNKTTTSGPLDVLEELSEEGRALYTWDLLALDDTYKHWTMSHDTREETYGSIDFVSPALGSLRQYGRIKTEDGIYPLSDALENPPRNPKALSFLLEHPRSVEIRKAFEIEINTPGQLRPIGEDERIPLIDAWPSLKSHLSEEQTDLELIRCDGIQIDNVTVEPDCVARDGVVYLRRKDDEIEELQSVLPEIGLQLTAYQIEEIVRRQTSHDAQIERNAIRGCSTDAERLLKAVGETELRLRLPEGLVKIILKESGGRLTGVEVAEAAIAIFHTDALREYRDTLAHLDPPKRWAGSLRAIEFVRSLGFGDEWAGQRDAGRDPYIEVEGPYSLPQLHDYQRKVVENVKFLIRSDGAISERRGLISMPTGSGKTRVAVQAIVESIRENGFNGGILWVADRDELCEQAVQAWRQVWSSEGSEATQLRISRMWGGQPAPLPTDDMHVIVATIQTLNAKINSQPESYDFLADFKLLVFDEAHRSVARTFTSVMEELGLTRWRRAGEPLLIGLTATPYRGHDERETTRLVNRYGANRLDRDAFKSNDAENVISELQNMHVLAQADHKTIDGGQFSLSKEELRQFREAPWLPRSVENRIARDVSRTENICEAYVEHIYSVDPDWPTLIFATSVEHSKVVAALLTRKGIGARAVHADTNAPIRRRIVEEFRSGDIKVLVNYGIFREGFDAPRTRAIIVARPVYSPNLYFQMIGRGLRGEKNGGNDRCLILNVRDNIDNFQRSLAFSDLDWLWA